MIEFSATINRLLGGTPDEREKRLIAKQFNDRYTYRHPFLPGAGYLTGTYYGFVPYSAGHAWMCPECNCIYAPTEGSFWTGLQYPACCKTPAGHRIHEGIRCS